MASSSAPRPHATGAAAQSQEAFASAASTGPVREIRKLHVDGDYALYGSANDNVELTGATIIGTLKIDGVHNVVVRDSHVKNVWFRDAQPSDNVVIEHNDISMADGDCIHIFDGAAHPTHVTIRDNNIHDCGLAHPNSDLYHGIYDQVPGVLIEGNCVSNARSAISIRANTTVENNVIDKISSGGGIEYFSDHDAEPDSRLVLCGNTILSEVHNQPGSGNSNRGLIILGNDIGKGKRAVASYDVRENKVVVLNSEEQQGGAHFFNVYVQGNHPQALFTGNTFVNLIPRGQFIGPSSVGQEVGDAKSHDAVMAKGLLAKRPECGVR